MTVPQTEEEWKEIQNIFSCLANTLLYVMHLSGSEYFNYKGTFSIILFASVDANYCFRYIDVGTNGRTNDAAVFSNSSLYAALQANMLNFPKNGIFVAEIFNYRLSRARRPHCRKCIWNFSLPI
ncbi:hypothetical protein NQ314_008221 [Rhamnusium bicolor]|uniref:DDE Tnp4 domain-containing protein n=1 Tax=Rhamnusium bicolor TaxID=1586634 RepID=A0AAV8YGG7_9CUCU|nr:hypothetical protein NQ314_008221 [Rhamnusium bicolor]